MRASLSQLMNNIQPGWDLVFLARKPIIDADFDQIFTAESQLLKRAGLFLEERGKS
jgi:ribonuclease P protein component